MRILVLVLLIGMAFGAHANELTGKARVIDGDTLDIGGKRVRLFGIDAPEGKQSCTLNGKPWRCGDEASSALTSVIGNHPVTCVEKDVDRYKRVVAVCFVGSEDLNDSMVRQGWALAYRQFSKDYVSAEAEAQREKRGIWKSRFEEPWKWRNKR
jgi:endonuclease YncB( thermonuclease family)